MLVPFYKWKNNNKNKKRKSREVKQLADTEKLIHTVDKMRNQDVLSQSS